MTSRTPFAIQLASVPDRDDLVAEVWVGQDLFAELRHESGNTWLQVYSAPGGRWELRFEELQVALQQARDRLGSSPSTPQDDRAQ
jgi:hypothetical protein